ncbi:nitroreductase [Ktedonosporobacter rubrisoli]|uniref:Nitroreductase n=1 Tax=Ktedonosporobacter rubrisoli TaxID=2509675 RepID=A0A4P6JLY2_KTERU|nr:nitroreductase family protein [Ktedonosporobacter rubrisoli]QBD76249.1 nitroreductase [Ktedonosporobacter rubrisoli]
MSLLDLSLDELLSTTRSVRKRLDFTRPVEPELINECLELAVQAPTGSNRQQWHFIVVTDQEQRKALGAVYKKGWQVYQQRLLASGATATRAANEETMKRVHDSSTYLSDHMHEAPVLIVPCFYGRLNTLETSAQASTWGSILPAVWNFMLAARARGLGTCWTTLHLLYEQEAAQVLSIPYEEVTQAALIPVAYTLGTDFRPGPRMPMDKIIHHNRW